MINTKTSSSISNAIKETMNLYKSNQHLIDECTKDNFSIKIANSIHEKEEVFKLGYEVYLDKGYIQPNKNRKLIQSYDTCSDTVIFIVQDKQKKIAGSITLVFSESAILPAENIYNNEIHELKVKGEKIVEISRLIVNPEFRNSKEVLILLFNYLAIFSFHVKKYNSLVIEVNPRHKNYYENLLSFDEIGEEKACPTVLNNPAILLYLPLQRYHTEVHRCKSPNVSLKKERSLYPYFFNLEQESLIAYYLSNQLQSNTFEAKLSLGDQILNYSTFTYFPLVINN